MNTRIAIVAGLAITSAASAAVSFGLPSQLATAQRPGGVASADFNADGIADLAVTADTPDRIYIFLGTGAGGFAAPTSIFTGAGSGPDSMLASDVNGDGTPDLVVVLKNLNAVRVYNNTAGVFTQGQQVGTGVEPVSLKSADLDGDGDADYVTANRDDSTVTVLSNSGGALTAASFAAGQDVRDAAPIDVNGDGQYEIAASNHDDRTITIHSAGTYAVQQTIAVNPVTRPDGLAVADFDGDGDQDLAAALSDDAFSLAATYVNNGATLATGPSAITNGLNAGPIVAADFDLDGDADLAVANRDSNSVSFMDNSGGVFAAGVATAAGARPEALLAADLDGNGSPDLAVSNRDSNDTWIFFSTASGSNPCNGADLSEPFGTLDLADIQAFVTAFLGQGAAADLDGNGIFDLADIQSFVTAFGAGCP